MLQFYGRNETGALSATTPDDPQEKRLRTAGRVIPEMHVRLLDPDTDADITATGGPGRSGGQGPDAAASATGTTPPRTQQLFTADGWMRMGDLATIDADGYLTVVGRTSDIIIRGGKNISAAQVEDEVASHPAVALCAAVAMPDETFGERVCVFVRAARRVDALDLDDLRAHLEARGTGKELWPERLVVLAELPARPAARSPRAAPGAGRENVVEGNLIAEIAACVSRGTDGPPILRRCSTPMTSNEAMTSIEVITPPEEALTPTERRVAQLAFEGMTNRAIAGTLFLSPKTVEANLSRVYRKLGISSRAGLAGAL